ncbi:hypothetical protein SAMN04488570_2317 [Nocardioides scoriae]|uniref:HNH nuclease domain-containing protein n=1 Tax=Nocardioides scoriae TaxID=642780 RepID=A0A1H1TRR3_9ACTN|nr:HNH endonuclease signature motif containing protein [Nocardioides scoriae]SDS63005.1 hypothetical protein SAMN04488570_2317 [Nocardioides scoriae]
MPATTATRPAPTVPQACGAPGRGAADQVIHEVRRARQTAHAAEVRQLELAVEWALLHPVPDDGYAADWSQSGGLWAEGSSRLAGEGAPECAEFAPVELAAALGITLDAGRALIADGLDLTHRLPRLWAHLRAGRVEPWRARRIAQDSRDLGPDAIAHADRLLSATPAKLDQVDTRRLVDEARLYHDPVRACEDERHQLAHRGVWLRTGSRPATTDVLMTLDTPDALAFDHTVGSLATQLGRLGDAASLDVRRARAAGLLASPQQALDLLAGETTDLDHVRGALGSVELVVHVTPADLAPADDTGAGAATVERLGAVTTEVLEDWVRRVTGRTGPIRIRPVLTVPTGDDVGDDPAGPAVDAHDPPAWMREAAVLRDATCVFPGCHRDSRRADLDHIQPYVDLDEGGPPGQTSLSNLAPLCRTHHRAKTHSDWDYERRPDGSYRWTSPTGHTYLSRSRPRTPPARPGTAAPPVPQQRRPRSTTSASDTAAGP